jgi:hypothetical protein
MYLSDELIEDSFHRLSSKKNIGKMSLERTSALMYFLAFDATVKKKRKSPLDFDPDTHEGQNNRATMELEFVRLVKLSSGKTGGIRQVTVLGRIESTGSAPEKRISSNFFTVPLKKASQVSMEYHYPNRPAPVFKMGENSTNLKWGIDYFDGWKKNLPQLLSETKSNTVFADLAVFVFKDTEFKLESKDFIENLDACIREKFSPQLADFWINKIKSEKIFWKKPKTTFQTDFPCAFQEESKETNGDQATIRDLKALGESCLAERVLYLEDVLDKHGIEYKKIVARSSK